MTSTPNPVDEGMATEAGRPGATAPSGSQASPGAASASPPSVSIPDADGWINWEGGKRPVGRNVLVQRRYRDLPGMGLRVSPAGDWVWEHCGNAGDIIAYRVVQP